MTLFPAQIIFNKLPELKRASRMPALLSIILVDYYFEITTLEVYREPLAVTAEIMYKPAG